MINDPIELAKVYELTEYERYGTIDIGLIMALDEYNKAIGEERSA